MEIEGRNALQQPGPIKFREDSKRRGRPIRHFRGTQAEAVPHRQAQALQKRNAEVAEALSGRDGWITMVVEFEFLPRKPFVLGQPIRVTDVVMGTYEERVVRIIEKRPDRTDFCIARPLLRPRRVEADDDEGIDTAEKFRVENMQTSIRSALSAPDGISGP